jgi:hypothetical protein
MLTEKQLNDLNVKQARYDYTEWRRLRDLTELHVLCDCNNCSKRRRLGARLDLPYSGAPKVIRYKPEYRIGG